MNRWLGRVLLIAAALSLTGILAAAYSDKTSDKSSDQSTMTCRDNWSGRLESHCEIKEQTIPASSALAVDARKNGGISIKGWDRHEILVRSRIQALAPTQSEADQLASQVSVQTGGGQIVARGPELHRESYWDVSYEIFVPHQIDLSLETYNGGISIHDVRGRLEFHALNGGVSLRRVGGSVHGGTTNGGLVVELSGDRWDGDELNVTTTNGGIVMSVPENYSAHLETGTVNGNLSIDFPVTVQGRITRELAVNLGSGGATVRAMTTNGGVRIRRIGSNDD